MTGDGALCGCALKNDWSDEEADAGECLAENPDDLPVACSRPDGHDGPHVACAVRQHPLAAWPNPSSPDTDQEEPDA